MTTRAVQFLSITPIGPADPCCLEPAPNVTDWASIEASLQDAPTIIHVYGMLEGSHTIRGSYRGWTMYLYQNVSFYRNDPQSGGVNGMAGWPAIGTKENVTLSMDGQKYKAQIEFV